MHFCYYSSCLNVVGRYATLLRKCFEILLRAKNAVAKVFARVEDLTPKKNQHFLSFVPCGLLGQMLASADRHN